MGIFDVFRRNATVIDMMTAAPYGLALESPNQTSSLAKVTISEFFVRSEEHTSELQSH